MQPELHYVPPKSPARRTRSKPVTYSFTAKEILAYLYSHSDNQHVNTNQESTDTDTRESIESCTSCDDQPNGKLCTKHKHLETLRMLRIPDRKDKQPSRAISSFPPEVELCTSSIPGKGYGVRTVRIIPEGTWIGPYEGKQVRPEDLTAETDTSYMWEIFQDGNLAYYLDGNDENNSSWMRFIRCARYKGEQNTSVMQYFGNIYYRVFKDIPPGNEILVWYDDTCSHHLGIPLKMQDIGTSTTSRETTAPKQQPAPVPPRLALNPPTTGNPPLPSVTPRPVIPTYVPHHGYPPHSLPPVVRAPTALPRYQVSYPMISRDTLSHNSLVNSTEYSLRELNDAYKAAAVYGGPKSLSSSAVIAHKNIHDSLVSHAVIPYSRDPPIIQSKTSNGILDQSHANSQLSHNQSNSSTGSRDVPHTVPDSLKVNLDQNRNRTKSTGKRSSYAEKIIHDKQSGISSSDNTINKFLTQIEEARIEEMKEKQKTLKEQAKESNSSQESEDALELSIWKCGECGKAFAQQQILQLHICSSVPKKPYKCTYCPEAFAQPSDLRTHAVIHNGKKPFKCGFCSRLFAGSTTLNNHIRTHTGERPFGCEKCGKDFSQASQLSRHRRDLFECK